MRHILALLTAAFLLTADNTPVARADDKPNLRSLAQIPPPGGVPLDFGTPGTPVKTDALDQAAKRLESAPAEDLDRWVAELERITDRKLEGDLAKQACRTYFVSRMSVAFDGLQWNARAAGKLSGTPFAPSSVVCLCETGRALPFHRGQTGSPPFSLSTGLVATGQTGNPLLPGGLAGPLFFFCAS